MVKRNVVPGKKIIAFILTYNCAHMLEKAWKKIPKDYVDDIVVSDDMSKDNTVEVAKKLGLKVIQNSDKKGYGGNLKNALAYCFSHGASYAVEIHGDGAQFDPIAIKDAVPLIKKNYDLILGSRFQVPGQALKNGMPLVRFLANRGLSFFDRIILDLPLTEFHTGFRIYSKKLFKTLPLKHDANNYLFSFEVIVQAAYFKLKIGEVPVEADYKSEHTSHNLIGASIYAFNTFYILSKFLSSKYKIAFSKQFPDIKL
jgi:glycosyltransferase involved in cell wall biosynthesis